MIKVKSKEGYVSINAAGVPSITLEKKDAVHEFKSLEEYKPYEAAIVGLIKHALVEVEEAKAKLSKEDQKKLDAEAKAKKEADEKAKKEAEELAKKEAEEKAKAEKEAAEKLAAEEEAKKAAEAKK